MLLYQSKVIYVDAYYRIFTLLIVSMTLTSVSLSAQSRDLMANNYSGTVTQQSVLPNCIENGISCQKFTQLTRAVIAAGNHYNPISVQEDREFIGAILYESGAGGRYVYTVGAGSAGSDKVTARVRIPKGYRVVAFWHTHGAAHWSRQYFSDVDTALVQKWLLPFYLTNHTGELMVFEPGSPVLSSFQAQRIGLGRQSGYARGKKVFNNRTGQAVSIFTGGES